MLWQVNHRRQYANSANPDEHAKELGVKSTYPDMLLPYHNRVEHGVVDGMHTIKDVITNIMDVVKGDKSFRIVPLELTSDSLSIADQRFNKLHIPEWLGFRKQTQMISSPSGLKSHDWKQVCIQRVALPD